MCEEMEKTMDIVKCKVSGCDREASYRGLRLCQKHYFRKMRNGHYGLKDKTRKEGVRKRRYNPKGYASIYKPSHPLAQSSGFVYEHRFIIYNKYGQVLPPCELCGKEITWLSVHIDHIDEQVANNNVDNLRPLCNACNTRRNYPEQHTVQGRMAITYEGETKTPTEWAREDFVYVCGNSISRRIRLGWSVFDALHKKPKTRTVD